MWAGLWQKRCKFSETATAIAYEQHGFFEQVMAPGDLQVVPGGFGVFRTVTCLSYSRFTLGKMVVFAEHSCHCVKHLE